MSDAIRKIIETKSYEVEAVYWDYVNDEEDVILLDVFARSLKDLEKQVKNYCGKSFRFINSVEVSEGFPVF